MIDRMLKPVVSTDRPDGWRSLGCTVSVSSDHQPVISHSGSNGTGFRCHSRFDPKTQTGLVIMTNGVNGAAVWQGIIDALKL
jgi:hypothetical protein